MNLNQIALHNVAEAVPDAWGYALHRHPTRLNKNLSNRGSWMAQYVCGCELRFVTEADNIAVSLLARYNDGAVTVFCGDNQYGVYTLHQGKIETIMLAKPRLLSVVSPEYFAKALFSPKVWRIYLHNCGCTLCDIDTFGADIRPPEASELPCKTMLSYGSSISHGASTSFHPDAYPVYAGHLLGYDVLVKGMGGSCRCEKELADYFADELKWDAALMEIGVNMTDVDCEVFADRFTYLFRRLSERKKPVYYLTIFPNSGAYTAGSESYKRSQQFNQIIRDTINQAQSPYARLIEGSDVLTCTSFLSTDGIHPSTEGHFRMGQNLYEQICTVNG